MPPFLFCMAKKAAFHTVGCKLNFTETSTIGKQFLIDEYSIVDPRSKADVYVINTCAVTKSAEKECRQIVRRVQRLNPDALIIVTGCYAQLRPGDFTTIDGVDLILGNNEKNDILKFIDSFEKTGTAHIYRRPLEELGGGFTPAMSSDADSRTRAFLKIQDGCDYHCTYCTVPLARGSSRSMPVPDVINRFEMLLLQGYREIILTGVNIGDYRDGGKDTLFDLLLNLTALDGEFRIRLSSIEPNLLSDDLIRLIYESEKIASHFHIPLQSGSGKILKLMKRRYAVSQFTSRIDTIFNKDKTAGIGVDVITGFPGESEKDFEQTYSLLESLPVSYLHVFSYSERPSTEAVKLPGKVPVDMAKKRTGKLRELGERKKNDFMKKAVGTKVNVLFEHTANDNLMKGFSDNYIRVAAPFNEQYINNIVRVKLSDMREGFCYGEIKG